MVNNTIPAPIAWTPSTFWDGNDGSWNTFIVQVGTPPQDFRTLPSTSGQELWIPVPDACTSVSPNDPGYCGYLRGTLPVDGKNSSGFATNDSSTWTSNGIFTLTAQESALGYTGNGLYGFDTVTWGNASNSPNLTQQVVAGIADPSWWLGQVGLGPKTINFTTFNDPIPSYLSNLVDKSIIPSHSFAYTAGAAYHDNAPASLTLGGHDTNRYTAPGVSIMMNADNSRPLQVGLQRIVAENVLTGTSNLLPTSTYHFVDSSVPHIWLPDDAIDAFVAAFGLTYDNNTDLFLINDTMRSKMLDLNPTMTFVLGESTTSTTSDTVSIALPYAAFDLEASFPFYQNATRYFPIRRAANDSQYTIGRTFFQGAYVIADFERSNFTVAQASFDNLNTQHLVAITKPAETSSPTSNSTPDSSNSLSGGAIAGIVIGALAGITLIALLTWFLLRRRRRRKRNQYKPTNAEDKDKALEGSYPDDKKRHDSELPSDPNVVHEVAGNRMGVYEADSPMIHEVGSQAMRSEVDGGTAKWGRHGVQELHTPPIGHENRLLAEVPGSEGVRYELAGE